MSSSDYFVLLLCILVSENVEMLLKLGPRLLAVTERGKIYNSDFFDFKSFCYFDAVVVHGVLLFT